MAGVSTQLLPAGETFEKPDWAASTLGSALDNCSPWVFHYASWNLSDSLLATDPEYGSCPFRDSGPLGCRDFGVFYRPDPSASPSDMPVHVTDKHGGAEGKIRGFVLREEDTFNRHDLSFEAQFGLQTVGGSPIGFSQQGSSGSSPFPSGVIGFPTVDISASTDEDALLQPNPEGNAYLGGGSTLVTPARVPGAGGWKGCGVAVRVGGGRPTLVASDSPATASSSWSWRRLNGYVLGAYPQGSDDLVVEIWRFTCNASDEVIPRQMVKQVIAGGAAAWKQSEPYHLRLEISNVGGNPTMEAFLGPYTQSGSTVERQLFRSGVFTSSTITVGPSGDAAVVLATGVVTDSGTDKISGYTDKTCGVLAGRDRTTTGKGRIEGLYRLTARRLDTDAIIYNDLFRRTADPGLGQPKADEQINGLFSFGTSRMGMWLYDIDSRNDFGTGISKIRRLALWTDSVSAITSPNDYVTHLYDQDGPTNGSVNAAARWFWHRRPSSQIFNHSRQISFIGATDAGAGVSNNFEIGLSCRGLVTQTFQSVIVFYTEYTINSVGNQSAMYLILSEFTSNYDQQNLVTTGTERQLANKIVHVGGVPPAGYDIGGGTRRTMRLDIVTDDEGTHRYTCYWEGSPVIFNSLFDDCVQDGVTGEVTDPSPLSYTLSGSTEGFFFKAGSATTLLGSPRYNLPRFDSWTEGALTPDNTPEEGTTIVIGGEGTPTVNLSSAVDVDWQLEVEVLAPKYVAAFSSGHRYTSPQYGKSRRLILARAENIPKTTYDLLVAFYNARGGVEQPFYFDFPIPSSLGSNSLTQISVCFTSSGLKVRRKAEGVYSVELEMLEVFV